MSVEGIAGGLRGGSAWEAKDGQRTDQLANASMPGAASGPSADHSKHGHGLSAQQVQNALATINQHLVQTPWQVHFDTEAPADQIWLNVVDRNTGQVVQKIPPEQVRELVAAPHRASGWLVNRQL
ncbi:MAG: flagellar protein FlaG [Alicyclobacillus sp.]|nr:flagellar protein FlaG [Alicyclobacillus sp.]